MIRVSRSPAWLCLAFGLVVQPLALLPILAPQAVRAEAARTEPLTIATAGGERRFTVEVMRTDAERSRGLMFRRSMAADHGMLFDFEQVQPISMWMKNTYLPLDMLFIRADGTIARIAADTEPLSTAIVDSEGPVLAVLELNAGTAAKLGIRPGDRVRYPLFGKH